VDEEYISLEEALQELGISEGELRAMITRGQIRAFGKAGEERFRRSAIESLKRASEPQATILPDEDVSPEEPPLILDDEEAPLAVDEPEPLLVEDESPTEMPALIDEDEGETSDTVMPTIELTPDEPALADEEHTEVATQEVSLADEDYLILEEDKAPTSAMGEPGFQAQEEEEPEEEAPEPEAYKEEVTPTPWATALLGLLTVLMLVSLIVFAGAAQGKVPAGVRDWVNNNIAGLFVSDAG